MTTRPHHRKLIDQLRDWVPEQVAGLLLARPDLADPPPADIRALAERAQQRPSILAAVTAASLPEHRLLQVIVCCRPNPRLAELAAALPEGTGLEDIEPVLVSLERKALVWRHDGRIHCSGTLRQTMPTRFGPPLHHLVTGQNVDYLRSAIALVRAAAGATASEPPALGRPPRKADLVEELSELLATPAVVASVLESAPAEAAGIAREQAEGHPGILADHSFHFSHHVGTYYRNLPTYWLFERGLLLPVQDGTAFQPREVGMALSGGCPVAELQLHRPDLRAAVVDPAVVDADAAHQALRSLGRLADLLDLWAAEPAKELKSGGLGVAALKQVAAQLEVDTAEAGRLVELAHLAGLLDSQTVTTQHRRQYTYESHVAPNAAAEAWLSRPLPRRWRQLGAAWLRAEHWPSASGRKGPDTKALPVLSLQFADAAPARRRTVLDTLAGLSSGEACTPDSLVARVYWDRPDPWLDTRAGSPATAIDWVREEAELLGIVAGGSLSSFGRALFLDDPDGAERALAAALPEVGSTFTLQADLTATVVGALERSVLAELRLLADVESTGAATTLRFSDASLRRALDAGRDADAILNFLEAHAAKGVPGPLAYLVGDVARRHGHVQVGLAGAYVTSEDPAVLADACSHRRTRKLGLRLLAPTVAISPQPPAKVVDGLRDAGFLPRLDDETVGAVALERPSPATSGSPFAPPADGVPTIGELPERFTDLHRFRGGWRHAGSAPELTAEVAAELAEAIIVGAVPARPRLRSVGPGTGPGPQVGAPDEQSAVEALLGTAAAGNHVLGLTLRDQAEMPVLLVATGWADGILTGIGLDDQDQDQTTFVAIEDIDAVMDLGQLGELTSTPRRRHRGSRRR